MARKLSIYVPDDLWERAERVPRPAGEKMNASALVQRALEEMVREHKARTAAVAAEAQVDKERLMSIVARLRGDARAEFERGYDSALTLAELLNFDDLSTIISFDGILVTAESEAVFTGEGTPADRWMQAYWEEWERGDSRYEAYRAGAEKAIRDLWEALREEWVAGTSGATADDTSGATSEK